MNTTERWNELIPEAFATKDHPILRAARGCLILLRLNTIDANDQLVEAEVLAGHLVRANRSEGIVLDLVGVHRGNEFFLPLVPDAFVLVAPGQYQLSCGTVISNPEFLAAFDIYAPEN